MFLSKYKREKKKIDAIEDTVFKVYMSNGHWYHVDRNPLKSNTDAILCYEYVLFQDDYGRFMFEKGNGIYLAKNHVVAVIPHKELIKCEIA